MILDLRLDAQLLRAQLIKQIRSYANKTAKYASMPPVSAVAAAYTFRPRGWALIHFDTRPVHKRDGHWSYPEKDVVKRARWGMAARVCADFSHTDEALARKLPLTIILPTGDKKDGAKLTDTAFSAILGTLIKDVLLQAKKDKLFHKLPRTKNCPFDIVEYDGTWVWPKNGSLGKGNLI